MATGSTKKTTKKAPAKKRPAKKASTPVRKTSTKKPVKKKASPKKGTKQNKSAFTNVLKMVGLAIALCFVFVLIYVVAFVHSGPAISLEDYKSNQAQTSIIYAKKAENSDKYVEVGSLHGEQNRVWIDYDKMPENVRNAFVSLEDKRFYKHNGVDWLRTFKAALTLGRSGGGSTLTQQLIKNLTEENQVTVSRKVKEILYALNMERNYSKDQILEAYLNTIPLGSGCYGVETAAEKYYGKELSQLNAAEGAVLACITKAPTKYNPLLYPENNKERQKLCLKAMYEEDCLSKEEYEQALNYHLIFTNSEDYKGNGKVNTTSNSKSDINSYYVDYVIDTVISDLMKQYNYTKSEATKKVYNGGFRIYSCQVQPVQEAAEYVMENRVGFPVESSRTETGENGTKKKVQSACTIMDYKGNIIAMVGGAGKKSINRGLNRSVDITRSPGSSIKPLSIYSPAMEEGQISYSTGVLNYALTINGKQWPQNFNGSHGYPNARVTVEYAVAESLNTCAAQVCYKMGTGTSMKYLTDKFHITTLVKDGAYTDNNISSMAVGGMTYGVNTKEMCAAYATFGNKGKYYSPRCYTKVTDFTGEKVILEAKPESEQAISEGVAGSMNHIMQKTISYGTGVGCGVSGFTTYMKTGTTSDTKDKWACGGTPYYVCAVWYGYDEQEEITNVGSSNPAARIWSNIMNRAHHGLEGKNFDYGEETVSHAYCTQSGLLAGPHCPSAVGYYPKNKLPETCSGDHSNSIHNSQEAPKTTSAETTKKDDDDESTVTEDNEKTTKQSSTKSTTAATSKKTEPVEPVEE